MATATAPYPLIERSDNDRAIFASLKAIHAAAHTWQAELTTILDAPPTTLEGRQSIVREQVKRKPQIDDVVIAGLTSIRHIFDLDVKEHEWGSADLVQLDLAWKDIENDWSLDAEKTEAVLEVIRSARDKLDDVIYICLANTMSPDINDRLPNLEIGQSLDLASFYGEDFPRNPKLCKSLILGLAQEQAVIQSGVIDVDSGVIYRIATTAKERSESMWRILGLFLVGLVLAPSLALAGSLLPSWPIPTSHWSNLLANYVFLFLGTLSHTLVGALKQKRTQTKPRFAAMDDWRLWLHVHEKQVTYATLWADVGFLLLTFMVRDLDWRAAFLAGYSIDSVTDLFLSRFESVVAKAPSQIKPSAAA